MYVPHVHTVMLVVRRFARHVYTVSFFYEARTHTTIANYAKLYPTIANFPPKRTIARVGEQPAVVHCDGDAQA